MKAPKKKIGATKVRNDGLHVRDRAEDEEGAHGVGHAAGDGDVRISGALILQFWRNFTQKLCQKMIFCPVGGGGAPSPFHFRTHSTSRAPRPHPQGKRSFFGVIWA